VRILPITDRQHDYAFALRDELSKMGFRVEVDDRNEKVGYKIREAQMQKLPYMLVLGDKEVEAGGVAVRSRKDGDLGVMTRAEFAEKLRVEVETRAR